MADEEETVRPDLVVGHEGEPNEVSYNKRDLLVYALGIGCKNTAQELPFLYEDHEQFVAFPTFPLVLPFKGTSTDVVPFPSPTLISFPPGLPSINPSMILHGEQSLEIVKPLDPQGGALTTKGKVLGLYDKGKGALMREETRFYNEKEELVAIAVGGSFIRGLTGFSSKDAVWEEVTHPEQALLYRLSGDYNPLHADPEVATTVGFDRPIIHGLCTYGHAARAVLLSLASGKPEALRSITARFSKPAFPGETLVTSMWKRGGGSEVIFQVKVKERDVVVLDGGRILLASAQSRL